MKKLSWVILLILHLSASTYGMKIIYSGKWEVDVQFLGADDFKELVQTNNGVVSKKYHKELTARTYLIGQEKFAVEFYDKQGMVVSGESSFNHLREVRFIKNQVAFLHPRISYYIEIDNSEAERLINNFEGKHLKKYKSEYPSHFRFAIYKLKNDQVIFQTDDEYYLYEDLEALSFDVIQVLDVRYPDAGKSGFDEFLKGKLPNAYNINEYIVDPKEAEKVIKNHELKVAEKDVAYDFIFKSILYQSPKGYFILIEDFDQPNPLVNRPVSIGRAHIFKTRSDFDEKYQKILQLRRARELNPELAGGTHIYQELSDKYGKTFPAHTFEEIKQLPSILNFDEEELTFTDSCLSILNEAIAWNYGSEEFFNKLITPILSYVGEYHRVQNNGDWAMTLDREGKVWEPRFKNAAGKEVFNIIDLYKDYFEAEYGIPMIEYYVK